MTKYLGKEPFSAPVAGSKAAGTGWENTFGKGREKCPQCGSADVRVSALDPNGRTCRSCLNDWVVAPPKEPCGG